MTASDYTASKKRGFFASAGFRKRIKILAHCLLILSVVTLGRAEIQYPYEYDFVSPDLGISGKLFLDAPTGSNGLLADIGPESYFTFALYGGYIPPVTVHPTAFSDTADPGFSFSWDSTKITTPLYIGFIQNSTFLSREFVNPGNPPPDGSDDEFDCVISAYASVSSHENLFSQKTLDGPAISFIASESTANVNGGGIVYNIPFYPGTSGEWLAVTPAPEPGQMSLMVFVFLCAGILTRCFRRDVTGCSARQSTDARGHNPCD
jgi:hypothetical protein